jgi:hypothetical protein
MIRRIRTSTKESNYEQVTSLDGVDFILRFLWNERDNHWFLTIRDAAGSDIITGIKLVADIPVGAHLTDERRPEGQIWTVDMTGAGVDPGLRDLGERVILSYVDSVSVV